MGEGFGKASSRVRHLHPGEKVPGGASGTGDTHQSAASSGDTPGSPTAPAPSPWTQPEPRGSDWQSGIGAFPSSLEQRWKFWCWAGSFGAGLEVLVPAGQRGSEGSPPRAVPSRIHGLTQSIPQEDQAADPAAHPSSVAQELLTSAGAARQPLGIPTGRKITPK